MAEHVHGCLNCRPDMVPDFSRDDPRYHDGTKCRTADGRRPLNWIVSIDGVTLGYTSGVFEGREGWALYAGEPDRAVLIHHCPNSRDCGVCVEPRFGVITVEHNETVHP
jgi:hypothetical protein